MADLDPLIRVRRHAIEQKQKFLAELYRQAEAFIQQKHDLEQQMQKEKEAIQGMGVEMLGFFQHYAQTVKDRVAEIEVAQLQLERRINAAQDDMRDAFAELKKIEIIEDQRKEAERQEVLKKENKLMDEIGIEGFRRAQDDD